MLVKPPICEFCGERFEPCEGAQVVFAGSAAGYAWNERATSERTVGQSPDVGWFCAAHAPQVSRLADGTLAEALDHLRTQNPAPPPESVPQRVPSLGELPCPAIEVVALHDLLRAHLDDFAAAMGVRELPEFERTSEREWSPMDGAFPPHCPFVDQSSLRGRNEAIEVHLAADFAHWNESELARAGTHLHLRLVGGPSFSIGGGADECAGTRAPVTTLHLSLPENSALAESLREVVNRIVAAIPADEQA